MYLEILILAELAVEPTHGYELKKRIDRTLGGRVQMNNNTLYPTLRRFAADGAVVTREQRRAGRPPRQVHALTDAGWTRLHRLLTEFGPELAGNDEEFLTRVAFFWLLDNDERGRVLDARADALAQRDAHLRDMEQRTDEVTRTDTIDRRDRVWPFEVLRFQLEQVAAEQRWIRELTALRSEAVPDSVSAGPGA